MGLFHCCCAPVNFLFKRVIYCITCTKGPHKATPPEARPDGRTDGRTDGILPLNDSIWKFYSPKLKTGECPRVDIVFFHGLQLGDFEDAFWKTWQATDDENVVWPKDWLSKKLPKARIYSASYNSSAIRPEGQSDMRALGENLVSDIIDSPEDIGQNCQVFLVGHSLGGIVIKQFILSARKEFGRHAENGNYKRKRERITQFLNNLNGIFYYATPHDGSAVADMGLTDRLGNLMGTSPILGLLKTLGTERARLNDSFDHQRKNLTQLRTFAVAEGQKTKYQGVEVQVVPPTSALQGADETYVNIKATHFTVCQATNADDDAVIGKLVRFIRHSLPTSIRRSHASYED